MKKIFFSFSAAMAILPAFSQDAAKSVGSINPSGSNLLVILMIIIIVVLAFVIYGMGQVLIVFGQQVVDKKKEQKKLPVISLLLPALFLSNALFAQAEMAAEAVKTVPNFGGLSATAFYVFMAVIAMELITILFLAFSIKRVYEELHPTLQIATSKTWDWRAWWSGIDTKYFTRAISIEKEADVLLDHNYDGIQELDNALPPWWKYGFYFTIVVAVVYLLNFHVLGLGKNPTEEYVAEMDKAKIEKEQFEMQNKDRIDEANVPMADLDGIAKGKTFFIADCWACHGKSGEGGAGPNLTDDYWIHKGSINDIYLSIKHGYPDKGMQEWSIKYNPKEISLIASFIKTLHGTNPPGAKGPQGDLFTDSHPASGDTTKSNVQPDATIK